MDIETSGVLLMARTHVASPPDTVANETPIRMPNPGVSFAQRNGNHHGTMAVAGK